MKKPQLLRCASEGAGSVSHIARLLFLRDFRVKERQSFLGAVWWFVPPLAAVAAFVFLRERGIFDPGDGPVSYPSYVACGVLLWQIFTEAILSPIRLFASARPMITQARLRPEGLVLAGLYEIGFHTAIRLALLGALLGFLGGFAWGPFLAAIPAALLLAYAGFTIGLFLAPISLLCLDVQQGLAMALPLWFLATPIVYFVSPEKRAAIWVIGNPAAVFLSGARDLLLGAGPTLTAPWLLWGGVFAAAAPFALVFVRRSLPILAEKVAD